MIAWDEQLTGARRIGIARGPVDHSSPVRFTREAVTDEAGPYPAITPVTDGALVVWTTGATDDSVLRVAHVAEK
jgi:hypothetical protein